MKNLPEEIRATEIQILETTESIKSLRGRIRSIEVDKTIEVADARNEQGKLIFTNADARSAAVERLCAEDDTHREYVVELKKLEHDVKVYEANFEKLKRDWRDYVLDREERVRRMDALFLREELRNLIEERRLGPVSPGPAPKAPF